MLIILFDLGTEVEWVRGEHFQGKVRGGDLGVGVSQPGVYVPLNALFLVHSLSGVFSFVLSRTGVFRLS